MKPYLRRCLALTVILVALPAGALALRTPNVDVAALREAIGLRALRIGDRGGAVVGLQRLLTESGFDPGPVDGVFGPLTEGAVKSAQMHLGIVVDGLAGRATLGALLGPSDRPERVVTGAERVRIRLGTMPDPGDVSVPRTLAASASRRLFALTFNGPPDPVLLPTVLAQLEQRAMRATFFTAGEVAVVRPELLARIAGAGHEVASAGYATLDMSRLTPAMMRAQLLQTSRLIQDAVGRKPRFFRPPVGVYSRDLESEADRQGLQMTFWSNVGATDAPEVDPIELAHRLAGAVHPGAILMVHQDRPGSVAALERLLGDLSARGYQSVTLSELLGRQGYL